MIAFLTTVFVTSLTGSLHCAGMCGPFALMAGICGGDCSGDGVLTRRINWMAIAGYHSGRMLAYVVIGTLAGALGAAVNLGGSLSGIQQAATWLAGGAMVVVGVVALMRQFGFWKTETSGASWVTSLLRPMIQRAVRMSGTWRGMGIGLLTCLMPCGWLYVFAITAAGTASPLWGAVTMLVFWAGTVPILAVMVVGAGGFTSRLRINLPLMTASLVILLGVYTMTFRAPIDLARLMPVPVAESVSQAALNLQHVDHDQLPCCVGE